MRIIGFSFKKISAERKKPLKGKIDIKTNIEITNIEKDNIDLAGDILKFSYHYSIKHEPEFSEILFEGFVLVIPDKPEDIKEIIKDWKKKKLSDDLRLFVYNFIIGKCNLKALQLEEEFSLPPHIPLPQFSKKQKSTEGQANYTG